MKDKVVRTKKEIQEAIEKVEEIRKNTTTLSAFEGSPRDVYDLQLIMLKHKIIKEDLMKDLHNVICKGYVMDWHRVEKTQWFLIGIMELNDMLD